MSNKVNISSHISSSNIDKSIRYTTTNDLKYYLNKCIDTLKKEDLYADEHIFLITAISSVYKELRYRDYLSNIDFSSYN